MSVPIPFCSPASAGDRRRWRRLPPAAGRRARSVQPRRNGPASPTTSARFCRTRGSAPGRCDSARRSVASARGRSFGERVGQAEVGQHRRLVGQRSAARSRSSAAPRSCRPIWSSTAPCTDRMRQSGWSGVWARFEHIERLPVVADIGERAAIGAEQRPVAADCWIEACSSTAAAWVRWPMRAQRLGVADRRVGIARVGAVALAQRPRPRAASPPRCAPCGSSGALAVVSRRPRGLAARGRRLRATATSAAEASRRLERKRGDASIDRGLRRLRRLSSGTASNRTLTLTGG